MIEILIKCKECGREVPELEAFPESRCLDCHAKWLDSIALSQHRKPYFVAAVRVQRERATAEAAARAAETWQEIEHRLHTGKILSMEALRPEDRRAEVAAILEARGFKRRVAIEDLNDSLDPIPKEAGVYIVLDPERFEFLYIGKAGGQKGSQKIKATLYSRIQSYLRGGRTGKYAGHSGGRDIWLRPNSAKLLICWKLEAQDPRGEEKALIRKYVAEHGRFPFANKQL